MNVIEKYTSGNKADGNEYILSMYYEHLKELTEKFKIQGDFTDTKEESYYSWNIAKFHIAQRELPVPEGSGFWE